MVLARQRSRGEGVGVTARVPIRPLQHRPPTPRTATGPGAGLEPILVLLPTDLCLCPAVPCPPCPLLRLCPNPSIFRLSAPPLLPLSPRSLLGAISLPDLRSLIHFVPAALTRSPSPGFPWLAAAPPSTTTTISLRVLFFPCLCRTLCSPIFSPCSSGLCPHLSPSRCCFQLLFLRAPYVSPAPCFPLHPRPCFLLL